MTSGSFLSQKRKRTPLTPNPNSTHFQNKNRQQKGWHWSKPKDGNAIRKDTGVYAYTNCHTSKYTRYSESNTNPNLNFYISYTQMPHQQQQKIGIRKWTNTATKLKTVPWRGLACCDKNVTTKKAETPVINKSAEMVTWKFQHQKRENEVI